MSFLLFVQSLFQFGAKLGNERAITGRKITVKSSLIRSSFFQIRLSSFLYMRQYFKLRLVGFLNVIYETRSSLKVFTVKNHSVMLFH